MSTLKETLYRELELKIITGVEGINFDPRIFQHLDLGLRLIMKPMSVSSFLSVFIPRMA